MVIRVLPAQDRQCEPFSPTQQLPQADLLSLLQGVANLYDRIERMTQLGPIFIDITWGAGGTTSSLTTQFVKVAHEVMGLETCMHLTCTNMPKEKVDIALKVSTCVSVRQASVLRGLSTRMLLTTDARTSLPCAATRLEVPPNGRRLRVASSMPSI